jgi:hypothetical protein
LSIKHNAWMDNVNRKWIFTIVLQANDNFMSLPASPSPRCAGHIYEDYSSIITCNRQENRAGAASC